MSSPSNIQVVQIDCSVIMKIAKHADTESNARMSDMTGETCQGLLTGLVAVDEHRLEITNCFPTARTELSSDAEDPLLVSQREEQKQQEVLDILRKFRNMNIDYELVGFYQSHPFGACFSMEIVDSLFDYQSSMQDGVVLIYDPIKAREGQLSVRAYRLSAKALDMYLEGDWSPASVKVAGITYENMFEEVDIVIKNSHLVNVLLAEISVSGDRAALPVSSHLLIECGKILEKCSRSLLAKLEDVNRITLTFQKFLSDKQRFTNMLETAIQERELENELRKRRGEAPLPFDDIQKLKKQMPTLATKSGVLEGFLYARDANALSDFAIETACKSIAKVFMMQAIIDGVDMKDIEKNISSPGVSSTSL